MSWTLGPGEILWCFACGRDVRHGLTDGPAHDDPRGIAYQTARWDFGVLRVSDDDEDRAAPTCWRCFWETGPHLWIDPTQWDAMRPVLASHELPPFAGEDPRLYVLPVARRRVPPVEVGAFRDAPDRDR